MARDFDEQASYILKQGFDIIGQGQTVTINPLESAARYHLDNEFKRKQWKHNSFKRQILYSCIDQLWLNSDLSFRKRGYFGIFYDRIETDDSTAWTVDISNDINFQRPKYKSDAAQIIEMMNNARAARRRSNNEGGMALIERIIQERIEADKKLYLFEMPKKKAKERLKKSELLRSIGKAITVVSKQLKKDSLGVQVITFVRCFYKIAKEVAAKTGKQFVKRGYIFGYPHDKFCKRVGVSKSVLGRLLNIAAGLGLITKITPIEANGIGEFWHKKLGIGMLQFKLVRLNPTQILERWKKWKAAKLPLKYLNNSQIENLFGVSITTHPEATDKNLRKIINAENRRVERQKLKLDKEKRQITEDPFHLGHLGKTYLYNPEQKYTAADTVRVINMINNRLIRHCYRNPEGSDASFPFPLPLQDSCMMKPGCILTCKTKIMGKYLSWRKFNEMEGWLYDYLPYRLIIAESKILKMRVAEKKVIRELFNQGLIAIATKATWTENGKTYEADISAKAAIQYYQMIRKRRKNIEELRKQQEERNLDDINNQVDQEIIAAVLDIQERQLPNNKKSQVSVSQKSQDYNFLFCGDKMRLQLKQSEASKHKVA